MSETTKTPVVDRKTLAELLMYTRHYPSERAALTAVDDVIRAIGECLDAGQTIHLRRFGWLLVVDIFARMGSNPKTGEPISIPAGRWVCFKPSKALLLGGGEV